MEQRIFFITYYYFCRGLTNAGPTVGVHAEAFAALTVVRARCVDTHLLASSIELLTLIYIWTNRYGQYKVYKHTHNHAQAVAY